MDAAFKTKTNVVNRATEPLRAVFFLCGIKVLDRRRVKVFVVRQQVRADSLLSAVRPQQTAHGSQIDASLLSGRIPVQKAVSPMWK